jgi:hypothetical protein
MKNTGMETPAAEQATDGGDGLGPGVGPATCTLRRIVGVSWE